MDRRRRSQGVVAFVAAFVGLIAWSLGGCAADTGDPADQSMWTAAASTDSESGLPWVSASDLPAEATDTIAEIEAGPPYPYDQDGTTFENREGLLPDHDTGYYHEFTVVTPGSADRGARRIIAGEGGEMYYTDDHYASFSRIAP